MNAHQYNGNSEDDELPQEPLNLDSIEDEDEDIPAKRELLTIRLFKDAIKKAPDNQEDPILASFADNVLPNLIRSLVGATAKGGQFTEDRKAEGKDVERSKHDQSFISHLLNGLFPAYRILRRLKTSEMETNPVKRQCGEKETRIYVASYLLHDSDKFPDYAVWLANHDSEGKFSKRDWRKDPPHKDEAPNFGRDYIREKITTFGLDTFLGEDWENHLDDIIWLTNNAGEKYDADKGMEIRGLQPSLNGRVREILQSLVKMSDLFASVIKHPRDIESDGKSDKLPQLLQSVSKFQLKFSYHSLSDNRGIITNIINNALIDAYREVGYADLLYLPDGVVYVGNAQAPEIDTENIPNLVIKKIKSLCAKQLGKTQTGFSRDGKGLKFADYYWLFFSPGELMQVSGEAARRLLPDEKKASAAKRSESLQKFKNKGELPENLAVEFDNEIQIDRLAEFGDTLCRGIWQKWCDRATKWQKQLKKSERKAIPELKLTEKLAEYLDLEAEIPAIRQIQALKKTGGVPLDWYYLAAQYYRKNPGKDLAESLEVMEGMVRYAASQIEPILQEFTIPDGWEDLRTYVSQVISLPTGAVVKPRPDSFLVELNRYHKAKINGRGRENVCAMSSSAYKVTEQMESGSLFAPQVYSNRQILFNTSAAKRQICSIWSIEIMLRQILMNKTKAIGADFENRKYRYLYLYPAYFFTPETNSFLQQVYNGITQTRFDAELRKHFVSKKQEANFKVDNYQQVDDLLIREDAKSDSPPETLRDRTFKISYPPDETLTFFFIALPPGRDATDIESWVMPSWLAFTLPLIMDVKVVVSESPVPPFISGADFEKTVVLDGEHQAIRSLTRENNYRLDSILPPQSPKFSPLNALTAAYCIHLEVNRKKDGNPDWGKLAALARDLETDSLYVFHYLTKWLRKHDKFDSVPVAKIRLYRQLYNYFDPEGKAVHELKKLTNLYRIFYRAKSRYGKANAILKPIDEAADVILKIDKALITKNDSEVDKEALIDIVAARLAKLMSNVRRRAAEGKPTLVCVDGKWKPALNSEEERQAVSDFATYFVEVVFAEKLKCDRARLAGTQLNLIRDTCEYLYRLADDEEKQKQDQEEPDEIPKSETEAVD